MSEKKIYDDNLSIRYNFPNSDNRIDDKLIKSIISSNDIDLNERVKIFKLYNFFIKFSEKDYTSLEKNIYSKFNIDDKLSIIRFEIERMGFFIRQNGLQGSEFEDRYNLIKGTYSLILSDTLSSIKIDEKRYDNLLKRIALLEFDMNMKLCLYNEINEVLYDKITNVVENKKNKLKTDFYDIYDNVDEDILGKKKD
mgnify:FL=1